jgi:hypothetical protein
MIAEMITLAAAGSASVIGFSQSRSFVRRKLRFVEAVQNTAAPVVAGFAALMVATPIVSVLPFVGGFTAIVFGASVGLGVSKGAKDIRERKYLSS